MANNKDSKEKRNSTPSDKKEVEVKTYTASAYCDIIGANHGIRYVANLKFRKAGRKTISEWEKSFKEHKLV